MISKRQCILMTLFFIQILLINRTLSAATHFTVRGSITNNNLGLNHQANNSTSFSVATDVGTFLRIGLTNRIAYTTLKGYTLQSDKETYLYSEETTKNTANSIDLTIILYMGKVFVPYLQLGIVKKNYLIQSQAGNAEPVETAYSIPPVPNAGFGLGIRLNQNFSLKLSTTFSPGVQQKTPDAEPQGILDNYTSIGLTYKM